MRNITNFSLAVLCISYNQSLQNRRPESNSRINYPIYTQTYLRGLIPNKKSDQKTADPILRSTVFSVYIIFTFSLFSFCRSIDNTFKQEQSKQCNCKYNAHRIADTCAQLKALVSHQNISTGYG